ncbi:alpha/beta fold hydrolase [Actinomyces sp. S4-C9]|uniref:alpha/beta fold hydrolase n=1 Tax=Actinomyces sp. S4-C9 TaxID=1219581 RepID=UPI000A062350|nr:alpha/beta fold hydrolase [Actinomyces sp. S4-C9]
MTLIAATDGSSLGNPGPAGWAWYMDEQNWSAGALEESTNNVGELLAVLDLLRQTRGTQEDLHIFADSQYVINALTKWRFAWKRKGWKKGDGKPVANREIMEALDEELEYARKKGRKVEFEWVRGHNDHNMNERADDLARGAATAIQSGKTVKEGPGFSHIGRGEADAGPSEEVNSAGEESEPSSKSGNVMHATGGQGSRPEEPVNEMDMLFSFDEPAQDSSNERSQTAVPNAEPARKSAPVREIALKEAGNTGEKHIEDRQRIGKRVDPVSSVVSKSASEGPGRRAYIQHGVHVTEHRLQVPLDYSDPNGRQIELFAREVTLDKNGPNTDQPAIIFMQGGPGGRAPRPGDFNSGWIGEALKTHRMILMDERGTGLSTRLDALTLSEFATVKDQVNYVKHFRADNMVRDAELLRGEINAGKKWASLGQSYGGFINTSYLSLAPEGLSAVYYTGGLPGLVSIDEIYRRTYRATAARNEVYFKRYEADQQTLKDVLTHLDTHEEILPTGERLTSRRLRMLGLMLGTTTGFDQLHYFFEGPFVSVRGQKRLNTQFLDMVGRQLSQGDSPMYGVLHETIYAGATPALRGEATNWAAERLLAEVGSGIPEGFAPAPDYRAESPVYLTGEHMYPLIYEEDPALAPMRELAHELAAFTDWEPVYNPEQLANNEVPGAAAVYFEDMFVPTDLSLKTAELAGIRTWVTNEYQHDGLRADGAAVFQHLQNLLED